MNHKNNAGFTLVEHLIAIVLLGMMLTTLVGAYSTLIASKTRSQMTQEATQYAREQMELIYNMLSQNESWKFFSNHIKDSKTDVCARVRPQLTGDGWRFNEGKSVKEDLSGGLFIRVTDICAVYRDSDGAILEIGEKPQLDKNTAKIVVTVTSTNPQLKEPIIMITYVTNRGQAIK